jgi:hypothetical protein
LTLERLGFHEITVDDPAHFPFIRGDIMAMQPHRGGYRNQKPRPSYAVYRY